MTRVGHLWPVVTSFDNLLMAAKLASKGKRSRADVAEFNLNLEPELLKLQRELKTAAYEPGDYHCFKIQDPKPRMISAAPFRDRVVHHALTQVLEPVFETRFSKASFACRKGYGTHKALAVAKQGVRQFPYVLKCDVRKYFASLDHEILKEQLARAVKCKPTLALAGLIIDCSNKQEDAHAYYPGDDLFSPFERRKGLPLGNQTSQFFANVYLDSLDQMVVRHLRPGLYARYVDDFVLFDTSKHCLQEMKAAVSDKLAGLRLHMHEGKSRIYRSEDGLSFLGWSLHPASARLARSNVLGFRRRIDSLHAEYGQGRLVLDKVKQRVQAWIAHAAYGDTWMLRRRLLAEFAF